MIDFLGSLADRVPPWAWAAYGLVYGGLIVLAVLLDIWLHRQRLPLISDVVQPRLWLGVVIIAWLLAGPLGLALHFFVRRFW